MLVLAAYAVNLTLMVMNLLILKEVDWGLPPSYFSDILLLSHVVGTMITLPGAATEFNQQLVDAIIFKFEYQSIVDQKLKPALLNAGYRYTSATSNMGLFMCLLVILMKIMLVISLC